MEIQTTIALTVFVLVIISACLSFWPLSVTVMIGSMVLVLTGCLEGSVVMSYFSSSTVLMLATVFLISAAFGKTQLLRKFAKLTQRASKGSERRMITVYVLLTLVLAQFMGTGTACFLAIYPLALASCREMGMSPSKVILPIAVISTVTCGAIPTTTAITYCEAYRGFFEAYDMMAYVDYTAVEYCLARIPLVLVTVLWAIFYVPSRLPERIPAAGHSLEDSASAGEKPQLSRLQEIIAVSAFFLMILGVVFGGKLGIPSWQITMCLALIVAAAGILRGKEVANNIGLSVILLYVGGTSISAALQNSGAADIIGDLMVGIFGSHPNGYVLGFAFFVIPMILSQVMSNGAVGYIFAPIVLITCKAIGGNPVGVLFMMISGAMTDFVTPMSNPISPIMFELGGYKMKDTFKIAPTLFIPIAVLLTAWVMTIFPLYG